MSFFGDLVNSIGTDKSPAPPKPLQRQPITSSAAHSNPTPRPKPVSTPSVSTPPVAGLKRKLEERDTKPAKLVEKIEKAERIIKPNPAPGLSSSVSRSVGQRPGFSGTNGSQSAGPKSGLKSVPKPTSTNPAVPSKPPTQLSYAEKLARAKAAQQSRPQNPIGTIKHQATNKEKPSKLAERRRLEQEKDKIDKKKQSDQLKPTKKNDRDDRKRSSSPVKKNSQVKIPRAPRPPLHAPASSYKGTLGTAAKRSRDDRVAKKSRYDDYLGTDEEEDSEVEDYDDGNDYGSDQSSDMEAGMDDIDMEEAAALKAAKMDDAKEAALENELKREKEERKRRLMAMAKKNR